MPSHPRTSGPPGRGTRPWYTIPRLRPILLLGGLAFTLMITWLAWLQNNSRYVLATSAPPAASVPGSTVFRFTVMSDVHVQDFHLASHQLFRNALEDAMRETPDSRLLVLNGDSTNGDPTDYKRLKQLLAEQNHPPVAFTMGNHEYYKMWNWTYSKLTDHWSSGQAVKLFDSEFGYERPYHEENIDGYPFLFLSGEAYRDVEPDVSEDAWLSDRQLDWLKERLELYRASSGQPSERRKPIFVFLHQPLPGTTDGSSREMGVVQHEALQRLLTAYPDVFLFSGHTHWDAGTTQQVWRSGSFTAIGSGSVYDTLDRQDQSTGLSESLAVEVRTDAVVIRFREHTRRRWIGEPVVIPYGRR